MNEGSFIDLEHVLYIYLTGILIVASFALGFLFLFFLLNPLIFIFGSYIFCLYIFFSVLIPKIFHYLYLHLSEAAV